MKYCIFSALYLPNLGGVERFSYNMAKGLVKNGHEVIIVTSNVFDMNNYEEIEGIKIYRLDCLKVLKGRFPVAKFNKKNRDIFVKIEKENINYVIVNTRFYVHSYLGVSMANKHKLPCITIEHGTAHFTINNKLFDKLGEVYEHLISWMVKRKCKDFYGVSQACNEWLKHFGINAKGVIYNAVDAGHIENMLKKNTIDYRKVYNVYKDDVVITYTGRLVREKGILKLLEAYKKIHSQNSNVHLFIAGDGDEMNNIKSYDGHNGIHVLGKIDFNHVVALLGSSDVFCLPTDYPEGFPTSVLEAAACRCLIVTTDKGGSKELVISDEYGRILKDNSVEEIYMTISELCKNKAEVELISNNCYNRVLANFTWDITIKKVMDIFEKFS